MNHSYLLFRGARRHGIACSQQWKRAFGIGSHVSDDDPEIIRKAQQRHLEGKTKSRIPEAPGWEEDLASDSEAIVKAERSKVFDIKEMQEETIQCLEDEQGNCIEPIPRTADSSS